MKILENYKKIAQELLFEVDDEKIIKYKDKDGESKEMKAGSAKTMPADHPAKQAWDKMQDAGDDSGAEKEKGQKIGGSDFGRDAQNQKVTGKYGGESSKGGKHWKELEGDDTLKHLSKKDLNLTMQFMKGLPSWFTYGKLNNLTATDNGDIYYSNEKGLGYWKVSQVGDDTTLDDLRADIKKNVKLAVKGKLGRPTDLGKNDGPIGGDAPDDGDEKSKMISKHGTNLPSGTDSNTKVSDLDEDAVDEFFYDVADEYSEEYDISRGVMADYSDQILRQAREEGESIGDLVDNIKDAAQEAAEEGGYEEYEKEESVKPKKKPFLKEQLERFGGLK